MDTNDKLAQLITASRSIVAADDTQLARFRQLAASLNVDLTADIARIHRLPAARRQAAFGSLRGSLLLARSITHR